jgi:hypothetical protein
VEAAARRRRGRGWRRCVGRGRGRRSRAPPEVVQAKTLAPAQEARGGGGGSVGADEEVHGHRRRRLPAEARWPYRAYEGCNGVRRRGVKAGIL